MHHIVWCASNPSILDSFLKEVMPPYNFFAFKVSGKGLNFLGFCELMDISVVIIGL